MARLFKTTHGEDQSEKLDVSLHFVPFVSSYHHQSSPLGHSSPGVKSAIHLHGNLPFCLHSWLETTIETVQERVYVVQDDFNGWQSASNVPAFPLHWLIPIRD